MREIALILLALGAMTTLSVVMFVPGPIWTSSRDRYSCLAVMFGLAASAFGSGYLMALVR